MTNSSVREGQEEKTPLLFPPTHLSPDHGHEDLLQGGPPHAQVRDAQPRPALRRLQQGKGLNQTSAAVVVALFIIVDVVVFGGVGYEVGQSGLGL